MTLRRYVLGRLCGDRCDEGGEEGNGELHFAVCFKFWIAFVFW